MKSSGPGSCLTRDDLERLATSTDADEWLGAHVDGCRRCRVRLAVIRRENRLLAEVGRAHAQQTDGDGVSRQRTIEAVDDTVVAPGGLHGYELLDEIRRGGQGVVYRALQTATKRTVALKVLRQGAFTNDRQRMRFEREVELVASLKHPNIVTVFDSGTTDDGGPFVAMEYVDGVPLDEILRERREVEGTPPPEIDEALHLFIKVCEAVATAHRRGIIHRDLKPANILVDEAGEPRVLDFGVAKIIGPHALSDTALETMAGEFVGTFAYAAPEQVAGDPSALDTRTDIYALGVILYEMLTGRRPYELAGSALQMMHVIVAAEPARPSALRHDLDQDLDIILLKLLDKDPEHRYQSVQSILDDVRHYLAGEPIRARGHDTWYVLRKTLRRYRVPVALATGAFLLVVAFAITMSIQFRKATMAELARQQEARRVTETLGSFLELLGSIDQENPQASVSVSSLEGLLEEASHIVATDLADLPEIAAAVRNSLGSAYLSQSRFAEAEEHFRLAYEAFKRLYPGPHPDVALCLHNLARLAYKRALYDDAARLYEESLAMRRRLHPTDHLDVARSVHHLAATHLEQGRIDDAERGYHEALAMRRRLLEEGHEAIGNTLNGLGGCLSDKGDYAAAARCFREAMHIALEKFGSGDWRPARAMHNLGRCLRELGRLDEAEEHLKRSFEIKKASRPDDHPDIAKSLHEMGRLALVRGDVARAHQLCDEAMAIRNGIYADDHPVQASSKALMGDILDAEGRHAEAESSLREAIEIWRRRLGDDHWKVADGESRLAAQLIDRRRYAEARVLLQHAIEQLEDALGPDAPLTRRAEARLELLYERWDRSAARGR